jgi:undecaprenyl-diphosphatase
VGRLSSPALLLGPLFFFGLLFFFAPPRSSAAPGALAKGEALFLGTVQGLTEYFPVSSSLHLQLAEALLARDRAAGADPHRPVLPPPPHSQRKGKSPPCAGTIASPEDGAARRSFSAAIQLASLLPVPFVFRRSMGNLARGLLGRSREGLCLLQRLCLATLPCIPLGLLVDRLGLRHAVGRRFAAASLLAGGIYLLAVEWFRKRLPRKDLQILSPAQALAIGLLQCLALLPGVSRSLMALAGCLLCGLSAFAAVEFTFLLGGATAFAAAAYSMASEFFLEKSPWLTATALGCLASCFCGWLGLALLLRWLRHGSLRPFAWYRIGLGLALLIPIFRLP